MRGGKPLRVHQRKSRPARSRFRLKFWRLSVPVAATRRRAWLDASHTDYPRPRYHLRSTCAYRFWVAGKPVSLEFQGALATLVPPGQGFRKHVCRCKLIFYPSQDVL